MKPCLTATKTFRITSCQIEDTKSALDGKSGKIAAMSARDLFTLRADAIQQTNHDWLLSAGVLVPICKNFVLETWGNFSTDSTDPSVTIKANFVFQF